MSTNLIWLKACGGSLSSDGEREGRNARRVESMKRPMMMMMTRRRRRRRRRRFDDEDDESYLLLHRLRFAAHPAAGREVDRKRRREEKREREGERATCTCK
jgi:hypothetical protein